MRDEEAALDIVQDAMLRLAEKYGDRPAEELPLLFHRIVQNAIRDWYRRQKVRALWVTPFAALLGGRAAVQNLPDLVAELELVHGQYSRASLRFIG